MQEKYKIGDIVRVRSNLKGNPRYYYDDIREVMKKNKITSVLFLYNGNTFVQDNSISGVLQND